MREIYPTMPDSQPLHQNRPVNVYGVGERGGGGSRGRRETYQESAGTCRRVSSVPRRIVWCLVEIAKFIRAGNYCPIDGSGDRSA